MCCRQYGIETDLVSLYSTPAPVRDDSESHGQVTPVGRAIVGNGFDASRAATPMVMALGMASVFADVIKQVPADQKSVFIQVLSSIRHAARCSVPSQLPLMTRDPTTMLDDTDTNPHRRVR